MGQPVWHRLGNTLIKSQRLLVVVVVFVVVLLVLPHSEAMLVRPGIPGFTRYNPTTVGLQAGILLEDGNFLLLESGNFILQE